MGLQKIKYEKIKNFIEIESQSGCELLTEEKHYKNTKEKLEIRCKCGNKFYVSFEKFKSRNKRACNNCSVEVRVQKYKLNKLEQKYGEHYLENLVLKVAEKHPNIQIINPNVINGLNTLVTVKCLIHNSETQETWSEIIKSKYPCSCCLSEFRSEKMKKDKNPSYNPNLTDEERYSRKNLSKESQRISAERFKIDDYTCQYCGDGSRKNHNPNFEAHHLDGWNWCEEKRLNIDNVITLCSCCHKEFHNIYGYGNNTKDQFEEWMSKRDMESKAYIFRDDNNDRKLENHPNAVINNKTAEKIKILLSQGLNPKYISKTLNISIYVVRGIKRMESWVEICPELNEVIVSFNRHKLTKQQKSEIINLYFNEGLSKDEIAKIYKCHKGTIRNVINNK